MLYVPSLIWKPWKTRSVTISDDRVGTLCVALPSFETAQLSPSWANQDQAPIDPHHSTNDHIKSWFQYPHIVDTPLPLLQESPLYLEHSPHFCPEFSSRSAIQTWSVHMHEQRITIFKRTFRTDGVDALFPSSDSSSRSTFLLRGFSDFLLTGVFGGEAGSFFLLSAVDVGFGSLVAAFFRGGGGLAPSSLAIDRSSSSAFSFCFFKAEGRVFFVGRASCISSSESSGCDLRFLSLLFCTISGSASSSCWSN